MTPATAAAALQRIWYAPKPTPAAQLLRPLAALFGVAAALRRAAYRSNVLRRTRAPRPVVVVGNITVGGTGKTPLVRALVEALAARGRRPGIVSRGYGRNTSAVREARGTDDAREVGDEPLLLAASGAPVWVGSDRVAAVLALVAAHPDVDVVVADDGLQHYALERDVEIAVIDTTRGLGNGLLLPAGPLREPPSRMSSVDAIVWRTSPGASPSGIRRSNEFDMTMHEQAWTNLVDPAAPFGAGVLADPASVALAGIADPVPFFDTLRARGFAGAFRAFADHHAFIAADVAFPGAPAILMTEKDAVKCRRFADSRMWMLPIRARIDPALVEFVLEKIDGSETPRNAGLPGHQGSARP